MKKLLVFGLVAMGLAGSWFLLGFLRGLSYPMYVFPDVYGPQVQTKVAPKSVTPWQHYANGSKSTLAILLTQEKSGWLGLAHGLKSFGVPFVITTDYREAVQHPMVVVYPLISGKVLSQEALKALAQVPRQGGTLVGFNVLGGGLGPVFGFEGSQEDNSGRMLSWNQTGLGVEPFREPQELTVSVGTANYHASTTVYENLKLSPVATFEDGRPAITQKRYETGKAYAMGVDLGILALTGYNNRQEKLARSYVNDYEPSVDTFFRFLKAAYQQSSGNSVTLGSVPAGKALTVILSHDIDFTRSIHNAVDYARYERSQGISGTYFTQVKYVRDFYDDVFFNKAGVQNLKELKALGMEVASHSIAHSKQFNGFELGSGVESYPHYKPYVVDWKHTREGSILGELRVSRFLIDHFLGNDTVVSFRPGHLSNPFQLPQALQATGFRYSSSTTANNTLTHLPFQLNNSRENDSELPIFEFPVTVEDEHPPRLDLRIQPALRLADQISQYGGLMMVLIHPDVTGYKLKFERELVDGLRKKAYFTNLRTFGDWWAARNQVSISVQEHQAEKSIILDAPTALNGLTLQIPADWQFQGSIPALQPEMTPQGLVLPIVQGRVVLNFKG